MRTEIAESGRFERTLTVHIPDEDLEKAKDVAARKLSRHLKIKGFRPGKAPRPLVERMVGADKLRSEAIEEALPEVVAKAIEEAGLQPVTVPKVTDIRDVDSGVHVDVRIALWPEIEAVPDYEGREIVIEAPEVSDELVEAQIDALRNQFAELETVERPAGEGDFVLLDLTVLDGGTELEDASASDLLYEVGSGSFVAGLDELLAGTKAGDLVEGPGTLPAGFAGREAPTPVTLRVLVKEVRAKKLPELTDEFVADTTEFETVEELREAITSALRARAVAEARSLLADRAVEALAADLDLELPADLVDAEVEARVRGLLERLERDEIPFGLYLQLTNQDQDEFLASTRRQAVAALTSLVLLEGIAAVEGLEVSDAELRGAIEAMAESAGLDADEVERALREGGRLESLTGDILRRKALERVVEAVVPVDAAGEPVDLTVPTSEEASPGEEPETTDEDAEAGEAEASTDPDEE